MGGCWASAGSFWSFSFKVSLYLRDSERQEQCLSVKPTSLIHSQPILPPLCSWCHVGPILQMSRLRLSEV